MLEKYLGDFEEPNTSSLKYIFLELRVKIFWDFERIKLSILKNPTKKKSPKTKLKRVLKSEILLFQVDHMIKLLNNDVER